MVAVLATGSHAQQKSEPAPAAAEEAARAHLPLADVVPESEAALANVRDIQTDAQSDQSTSVVAQQLPTITREIDARLRESRKIVSQSSSVEMLANLEAEWRRLRNDLYGLNNDLSRRIQGVEGAITQLDDLAKTWEQNLSTARESTVPPEVLRRIDSVVRQIQQARESVEVQRSRALTLQTRVSFQVSRVANVLLSISHARESVLHRLFLRDGAPIWDIALHWSSAQELTEEGANSFARQWAALSIYAQRQAVSLVFGAFLLSGLTAAIYWIRGRASKSRNWIGDDAAIIALPVASAVILTLLAGRWIFPQAPRVFWILQGALLLLASVAILRCRTSFDFHPLLYALIGCFFLSQLRSATAAVEFLPRILLLAEMFFATALSIWLVCVTRRGVPVASEIARPRSRLRVAGYTGLAVSSAAGLANTCGYVTLATLLSTTLVQSSYLAVILHAAVEVLDSFVNVALRMPPMTVLGTVRRHHRLLHRRIRRGLQLVALVVWILAVLQQLLIRERLFSAVRAWLTAELAIGSIRLTAGDVIAFAVTIWAAFVVSRLVRFLLDEEIYTRVALKRGLPYAISRTVHYLVLLSGFFFAVAALGIDMTRVTILAGAFSVGVGFGLQNIFNNFISGLILLFERPINVGDVVQIDDASGVVERIGVRASIIRMTNGSEIIMPNGKLISERVINATVSSRQHGIELPIAVAQDTDPHRVIQLLEKTAAAHPLVVDNPPPRALLVKLGPDSFGFELRAWTDHSERWTQVRSEIAITVHSTLVAKNISIR